MALALFGCQKSKVYACLFRIYLRREYADRGILVLFVYRSFRGGNNSLRCSEDIRTINFRKRLVRIRLLDSNGIRFPALQGP